MKNLGVLLISLLFVVFACSAQDKKDKKRGDFRFMFYNVENLFDIYDDTLKNDEDFLPRGSYYWTEKRFKQKLANISKVITTVGGWEPPEIVGLSEIENKYVLEQLTKNSPLSPFKYEIIHYESPDNRGVDVGMLYQKNKFTPLSSRPINVTFPFDKEKKTRDILYVKGIINANNDTLHIFINHWPSRLGGQMQSEPTRIYVAGLVKKAVYSILTVNPNANIIVAGDLNDYPTDRSTKEKLNAHLEYNNIVNSELYNLSYKFNQREKIGSHKYNGEWGVLDQIIVSGALINKVNNTFTNSDDVSVLYKDFLLERDERFPGFAPKRTYIGKRYNGGFSDHLPTFIDLYYKK